MAFVDVANAVVVLCFGLLFAVLGAQAFLVHFLMAPPLEPEGRNGLIMCACGVALIVSGFAGVIT